MACAAFGLRADVQGSNTLSNKEKRTLLKDAAPEASQWREMSLKGKLQTDLLPLSPSVKVYMKRDSLIVMSFSAPFVGEAARIEIDPDSIVAVNKMKRTYATAPTTAIASVFPGALTELQDFLTGKVVICGQGLLGPDLASGLDCYPVWDEEASTEETAGAAAGDDPEGWLIMPRNSWQPDGARYGYVLDTRLRPASMVVELDNSDDYAQIDYLYKGQDVTFSICTAHGDRTIEADLTLAPTDKTQPMARIGLNGKYTKVPVRKLLKL